MYDPCFYPLVFIMLVMKWSELVDIVTNEKANFFIGGYCSSVPLNAFLV